MAARFQIGEIAKATGGILAGAATADTGAAITGVSTDTRTLKAGEAFFALKGENHDAHDHLSEAAATGAAMLIVSDADRIPNDYPGAALVVEDTLRAYQDLAAYYRQKIDPFVIAVTGSVGKTTVKDMIACILAAGPGRVYSTQGNINNMIGLPRTILEAPEDTAILVLEMGLAYAGDIERLCEIARPDVSVITNVGLSHRENFNTDDGILMAKFEITAFLEKSGTLVIDAGGNEKLGRLASEGSREKGYRLLRIAVKGTKAAAYADYVVTGTRVCPEDSGVSLFEIRERTRIEAVPFEIPAPGSYAGVNAAIASCACGLRGVRLGDCAAALKNLRRTGHRLDPVKVGGVLVIDDTYNASPDSAKSGLEYLKEVTAEKRIAVLADMNELGSDSESGHREVGAAAVEAGVDSIYVYGEKARAIADGAESAAGYSQTPGIFRYGPEDKEALIDMLRTEVSAGSAIYVKGSRSMKMEEVVAALLSFAADTEKENGID